jgi:hypothetical protein
MDSKKAVEIARQYLSALERRVLSETKQNVAPASSFIYPGDRRPASVDEILASSRARYKGVFKSIQRTDVLANEDGSCTVYIIGFLHGTWADGVDFKGIRFIDRFEIADDGIRLHEVWNDAADARARLATQKAS